MEVIVGVAALVLLVMMQAVGRYEEGMPTEMTGYLSIQQCS